MQLMIVKHEIHRFHRHATVRHMWPIFCFTSTDFLSWFPELSEIQMYLMKEKAAANLAAGRVYFNTSCKRRISGYKHWYIDNRLTSVRNNNKTSNSCVFIGEYNTKTHVSCSEKHPTAAASDWHLWDVYNLNPFISFCANRILTENKVAKV